MAVLCHMHSTTLVNQCEIKDTCIEFAISNVSPYGNNVKIKLNLKVEEICRDCSPDFLWIKWQRTKFFFFLFFLPEAYLTCETPNMECFAKIVNSWMQSTIFVKSSILDALLGSEYISNCLGVFFIIMNWGCHFESSKNVSNLMSILFKYLEQKFSP